MRVMDKVEFEHALWVVEKTDSKNMLIKIRHSMTSETRWVRAELVKELTQ